MMMCLQAFIQALGSKLGVYSVVQQARPKHGHAGMWSLGRHLEIYSLSFRTNMIDYNSAHQQYSKHHTNF